MKPSRRMARRESLQWLGVGATTLAAGSLTNCQPQTEQTEQPKPAGAQAEPEESPQAVADRERRMKWWHAAKFGMFIHWGLYSVYGHHEWAMQEEGIRVAEYEQLHQQFKPKPAAARRWG